MHSRDSSAATSSAAGRIPGPQVPPRNAVEGSASSPSGSSTSQQPDRMLSVSGKKKCSHCKEELGELLGAMMSTYTGRGGEGTQMQT